MRETGTKVVASNRKARRNYEILDTIEAGLVLRGSEVKSLRQNGATIVEGYAKLEQGELWLYGVHVPPLKQASYLGHEPTRKRKCLVHRRELRKLEDRLAVDGTTLLPLSLYFKGVRAKVELGVGRGRRKADRREREKELEARRTIRSATARGRGRDDISELPPVDEDHPRREPQSGGIMDLLMFRVFIAPWLIILVFWIMSGLVILFGMIGAVGALFAMSQQGVLTGLLMLVGVILAVPLAILYIRVGCETAIIFFRQYDAIVDVRKELEKRRD